MKKFWTAVNKVISTADILLLLLDARLIEETRNKEIEDKVKKAGKPLIYVITKSDLVDKSKLEKYKKKIRPCAFISAKLYQGTNKLRERILIEGSRAYRKEKFRVGVLGYPNVGKSSLINAMKGSRSASTSSASGHTKGVQNIKADNRIMFIDTPGVIPYKEKDTLKHASIGTIDYNKAKDPDLIVLDLVKKFPGKIESHYKINSEDDIIEEIALKRNLLKKGGEADIMRAARQILKDWQEGKIK